ncbi:MAG: TetR/AcrR family transcriptional regulator [Gemmatimonadaceae bacterium]|jgi:AcrR family transcriptional regulator|nr:TetR/AcrR family transcriptional regulator [Gemmatimonadaceae bacterium]
MSARSQYRHGDLRAAALEAARAAVAVDGAAALSLRAVARDVGVTHAALYRHFPDRDALLAELGVEALQQLAADQERARARTADPARALEAVALAYFRYALRDPALFRVAFVLARKSAYPALRAAADAAERPALLALHRAAEHGLIASAEVPHLAVMSWALLHGFSTLAIDGQFGEGAIAVPRGATAAIERALVDGVRRLLRIDAPT